MEETILSADNATNDTPDVNDVDTLESAANPAENTQESDGQPAETGTTEDNNPTEQLIFGKYKSLEDAEKGYREAEKAITKATTHASELQKQLEAYQKQEADAAEQREIAARQAGFADEAELQVRQKVKQHEFQRYVEALETTLSGDNYQRAYSALLNYQNTGNPRYLELAQGYFSPATVAKISGDVAVFSNNEMSAYMEQKNEAGRSELRAKLEAFSKENADWISAKERQEALGLLISLGGNNLDFAAAKAKIDALEAYAIAEYQKKQAVATENQNVQNSLQAPAANAGQTSDKKWITFEEYNAMTPEEYEAKRDLIEEQVALELQGKLARRLTR